MQHAHAFEVVQDGRIYIEKINGPFLYIDRGTPDEYAAGLALTIERGWLELHDSGTFRAVRPSRCGPVRVRPELRGRCTALALPG